MPYDVVCLGSGILGVSIASDLVERGYRVAVVAKEWALSFRIAQEYVLIPLYAVCRRI